MFGSGFPELITRAEPCVLNASPRLVRLFSRSFDEATFVAGVQSTAMPVWWQIRTSTFM